MWSKAPTAQRSRSTRRAPRRSDMHDRVVPQVRLIPRHGLGGEMVERHPCIPRSTTYRLSARRDGVYHLTSEPVRGMSRTCGTTRSCISLPTDALRVERDLCPSGLSTTILHECSTTMIHHANADDVGALISINGGRDGGYRGFTSKNGLGCRAIGASMLLRNMGKRSVVCRLPLLMPPHAAARRTQNKFGGPRLLSPRRGESVIKERPKAVTT